MTCYKMSLGRFLRKLVLIYYVGQSFSSTINFVPFSARLDMLSIHRRKKNFPSEHIAYNLSIILLILEENASIVLVLDSNALDVHCLNFLYSVMNFYWLVFRFGVEKFVYIIINHQNIFCPLFNSFELTASWIFALLLIMSSDVHPNPGPPSVDKDFSSGFLSFCNWNLNTLSKDNFYRISLLEAHNTIFKYDIISLCETSLSDDLTVPENALPGYTYHPLNSPTGERNGGVGIFFKESLPLRVRYDLSFDECLVTELKFGHKKIFFTVFYRNPKHKVSSPEFENFILEFETLSKAIHAEKPYATFYTGDVNGHTQAWYPEGDTTAEGTRLDDAFSNLDLHQLISEPTHFFRDDCAPSCIDIILNISQT